MVLPDYKKDMLITEARLSASRSSGPGGQNVNKVSTKIELRFHVESSAVLTPEEKKMIATRMKNRINAAGEILVTASSERSQWKNRKLAEIKFIELVEKALTIPKRRQKTKPTTASKLKRIENKKKQAQKKEMRKPPFI